MIFLESMMSNIQLFSGIDQTRFKDFMIEFKIIATINEWSPSHWSLILGAYLTGPALYFYKSIFHDGMSFEDICDKINAEFSWSVDHVGKFYTAQQGANEDFLSYFYRLTDLANEAKILDDSIFIKKYLRSILYEYKEQLCAKVFKSKAELRAVLQQMNELLKNNVPVQSAVTENPISCRGLQKQCYYYDANAVNLSSTSEKTFPQQFDEPVVQGEAVEVLELPKDDGHHQDDNINGDYVPFTLDSIISSSQDHNDSIQINNVMCDEKVNVIENSSDIKFDIEPEKGNDQHSIIKESGQIGSEVGLHPIPIDESKDYDGYGDHNGSVLMEKVPDVVTSSNIRNSPFANRVGERFAKDVVSGVNYKDNHFDKSFKVNLLCTEPYSFMKWNSNVNR